MPGDEGQRRGAGLGDVLGVLDADDPEVGLLPGRAEDLAGGEELAPVQAAGEVEDQAPCITVLSTSKNAADGRVGRRVEGGLDLGGRGRRLAGQRRALLEVQRTATAGRSAGRVGEPSRVQPVVPHGVEHPPCDRLRAMRARRRRARWPRRPPSVPDRLAVVEARRTPGHLGRAGGRGRPASPPGSRRRGHGRRPPGDDRARQPDRVRHGLPRRAARPGWSPYRSTRARTTGELARMIADSRRPAWWSPTPTTVDDGARRPSAGLADALAGVPTSDADLLARAVVAAASSSSARRAGRASTAYDDLRAAGRRRVPPPRRPGEAGRACSTPAARRAGRAPRCSPTGRCWPTSSRSPQVEPPMIHGDDVVLGVLPLFHVYGLNAVLGSVLRHRRQAGAGRRLRPAGHARPDRGRGGHACVPGRAAGLRLLAAPSTDLASGSARCGWCCPARRRCSAELIERVHRRAPASRSTRATASPRPRRWSPAPCAASELAAAARSAPRCPASRSGWSTRPAASPRARTPARSRSAAPTCSAATGPTAPTAPTTSGWWATGDVGFLDADGDLFLVDRLKELVIVSGFNVYPSEVEDVIARGAGGRRGGRDRGRRRRAPARPWSPTSKRRRRRERRRRRGRRTRALRRAAGPLQAADADRGRRRAAAAR